MRITCILRSRVLVMSALAPKRRRIEHNPETRARLWREWEATHEPCPLRRLQNNPGRLAVFVSALDALKRPACVTPPLKTKLCTLFQLVLQSPWAHLLSAYLRTQGHAELSTSPQLLETVMAFGAKIARCG
jgi:hypothetical protein